MTEFLQNVQNAWQGWESYIERGRLAALLLAVLLFLWYGRKWVEQKSLLIYTSVMTACCIFPVTAALLMNYQTKFYDYIWIWSLVPAMAVTAYGGTVFLEERWEGFKASGWRGGIPAVLLLLAAVLLSGGLGRQAWDWKAQRAERQQAYAVLGQLLEAVPEGEICLWAPREVMEYAREMDGRIRLPYGRDMWDASLKGYSYDVYGEELTALCRWMERAEDTAAVKDCVQQAQAVGVNCVLLPEDTGMNTVREMEKALHINARLLEDYWIFYGRAD